MKFLWPFLRKLKFEKYPRTLIAIALPLIQMKRKFVQVCWAACFQFAWPVLENEIASFWCRIKSSKTTLWLLSVSFAQNCGIGEPHHDKTCFSKQQKHRPVWASAQWSDWLLLIWAAPGQNQQNDICAQRRLRSAWATAQSDQGLLSSWRSLRPLAILRVHSEDWLDWADAQADPSLRWAHRPYCWFCHAAARIYIKAKPPRSFWFGAGWFEF